MLKCYLVVFFSLFVNFLFAQSNNYERTWFFGQGHSLHFNNGIIEKGSDIPEGYPKYYTKNGMNLTNLSVSNSSNELHFFIQIRSAQTMQNFYSYSYENDKIFDKNGNPFPNGNIISNNFFNPTSNVGHPIIIPFKNTSTKFFLFYSLNGSLNYSIIDMNLNNGLGDIDIQYKDIELLPFGSIIGMKKTAIEGCEGMWLIVKSLTLNSYYSFKIINDEVIKEPVISNDILFNISDYILSTTFPGGVLKASNNGLQLAAATNKGIELYDFEPCSGKLKNARIIDTMPAYGLCFSPDDSKLYVSRNIKYLIYNQGEIYQYNMNAFDILSTKTLVMRNPIYHRTIAYTGAFGEMKLGLDGKIYLSKNNNYNPRAILGMGVNCNVYISDPKHAVFPINTNTMTCKEGQYMHVIHYPDELGINCVPEQDYLLIDSLYGPLPGLLLQSDIKAPPSSPPDTTEGYVYHINVCFELEKELFGEENGACYLWDDGSTELNRVVDSSGIYWLSYFKDCTVQTDTFKVNFIKLPEVPAVVYGCPADIQLNIKLADQNTTAFLFTLENSILDFREIMQTQQDITFTKLEGGEYSLRIQTPNGCDTTLIIQLEAYPLPEIMVSPKDTLIYYGDAIELLATGASFYHWWPSGPLDSATTSNPLAMPLEPMKFTVLGINAYGCRDSTSLFVDINYDMPDFLPNAFSPNGDGLNDVFKIEGLKHQTLVQFRIFNRLGQEIFFSSNPNHGWDGNFQGKPCDVGVYYYIVEIANPNGKNKIFKGEITLIR